MNLTSGAMMSCQKCRTPLKLDASLQDLNPAAYDVVVSSTEPNLELNNTLPQIPYAQERRDRYERVAKDANSPVFKRVVPQSMAMAAKAGTKENPAMSFVMLTDSQVVPPHPTKNGRSDHQGKSAKPSNQLPPDLANELAPELSNESRQALSYQIEYTTKLFEILSSRSDIDHPICTECTDILLSSYQSRLSAASKERDAYIAFLKNLNNNPPTPSAVSAAQTALNSTRAAESRAFSELLALEREKAALETELADLEAESLALDDEEQSFWRSRNAFALKLSAFQNDRDALNAAYDHDARQLERLQRTNVYNDTFCIGHDGFFGTINGLRLGRLPAPQSVEWSEINAAWGTACLLLATVAEKLGFAFRGYKPRPMGSTSRIDKIEQSPPPPSSSANSTPNPSSSTAQAHPKTTPLDLFSSGDLPLGRMLLHRRLDAGMVAFLECLRQLGEFVETGRSAAHPSRPTSPHRTSPSAGGNAGTTDDRGSGEDRMGIKLPYEIHKDRIGDASIRLGVSQDEAWTRACKYVLTCCKFLLAHASNVAGVGKMPAGVTGNK
jgi:beclin 1